MDCEGCREVLSAGLDDEAGRAELADAEEHLANCAACREQHAAIVALHRRLRLRPADAVPDLAARITAAVPAPGVARRRGAPRPGGPVRRRRTSVAGPLAAAAALVVVVAGAVAVERRSPDAPGVVEVSDVFATPASQGGLSSVYLTLRNRGADEDALVQVDAADAHEVELHATVTSAGGVPVMRSVDQFPLGAGATRTSGAGRSHLMLVDVDRTLRPGDSLALVLHFGHAPEVHVEVPVVDLPAAAVRSGIALR